MSSTTDAHDDRLKYLKNKDIRAEIAYAVGGDPTEYDRDGSPCLRKHDLVRVADTVSGDDAIRNLSVRKLYDEIDAAVPGMDHDHTSGNSWGISRDDLKAIHAAVGGRPYDTTEATDE